MCTQTDVRGDDLVVEVLHIELHHSATQNKLQYIHSGMFAALGLTLYKREVPVHYCHLLTMRTVDFVMLTLPVHHSYPLLSPFYHPYLLMNPIFLYEASIPIELTKKMVTKYNFIY